MTEEDEAFNDIEKAMQRKVAHGVTDGHVPSRNDVLEEVAEEIEKFHPAFGQDTVYSFAAFVRGMKRVS
jgi:hypothetical protein